MRRCGTQRKRREIGRNRHGFERGRDEFDRFCDKIVRNRAVFVRNCHVFDRIPGGFGRFCAGFIRSRRARFAASADSADSDCDPGVRRSFAWIVYNRVRRSTMNTSDFNWLVENGPEIVERYAGKWIAVHDGKVIGVGETAPEADAQAREQQPDGDFILEAVDRESDVIYAGL